MSYYEYGLGAEPPTSPYQCLVQKLGKAKVDAAFANLAKMYNTSIEALASGNVATVPQAEKAYVQKAIDETLMSNKCTAQDIITGMTESAAGGATGTKQLMTWEQLRQYQKANQLTFTPGAQPINTPFYLQPQQATAATAVPAASGTGKTALLVAAIAGAAFFLLR